MEKIINSENYRSFAYVNDGIISGKIKGLVVRFHGLGGDEMFDEETNEGKFFAERGILYVVPYQNPWAWMNSVTVKLADEIIDVLFSKYSLPESTPIVSCGDSMGGQSCLVYAAYAKRTPIACVANCPVCDLPFHYTERPDLPRTLYSAFWHEDGDIEDVMKAYSPYHLVSEMPRVKYYVFHCEEDKAVNINKHSNRFVSAMQEAGFDVTYHTVPRMGHCSLTIEMRNLYLEYAVTSAIGG